MFSSGVFFLSYIARLQWFGLFNKPEVGFSICLTHETGAFMKKKTTTMRGICLNDVTYKAVERAAKERDYASPSAFMRAAIEKELRGGEAVFDESGTAHQCVSGEVLEAGAAGELPEQDDDTRRTAVARGKLRYSRFLKSVRANMVGDAHAALSKLVNRAEE